MLCFVSIVYEINLNMYLFLNGKIKTIAQSLIIM